MVAGPDAGQVVAVQRDGDLAQRHLARACLAGHRNAVRLLAEHPDRAVGAHVVQVLRAGHTRHVAPVLGEALDGVARAWRPEAPVDLELDGLDERSAVGRAGQRPHELSGHRLHGGPGGAAGQPDIDDRGLVPGRPGEDLDLPQPRAGREGGDRPVLQPAAGIVQQVVHQRGDKIAGLNGDEHRGGHEELVRLSRRAAGRRSTGSVARNPAGKARRAAAARETPSSRRWRARRRCAIPRSPIPGRSYWRAAPPRAVYCPLASRVASSCQLTIDAGPVPLAGEPSGLLVTRWACWPGSSPARPAATTCWRWR